MSLVTTTEAADYLGVSASLAGLQDAIDTAEALVAAELGSDALAEAQYKETYRLDKPLRMYAVRNGPLQSIDQFTVEGTSYLNEVKISDSGWGVIWEDFRPFNGWEQPRRFWRGWTVSIIYTAGYRVDDNDADLTTLPASVKRYIMAETGLSLNNLLFSGVNDVKLGDMTVKIQRERLLEARDTYRPLIARFGRGF